MEEAGGDGGQSSLEEEFHGGLHGEDTGQIEGAGFVASGPFVKLNLILGDEIGRLHIPGAEEDGTELVEAVFVDVNDAGTNGAEKPFMGVGTDEIGVLGQSGKGSEGLNAVQAEQDTPLFEFGPDSGEVEAKSGEKMAGGQGDEFGFGGQGGTDEVPGDLTGLSRMKGNRTDAHVAQGDPWIDVGRVIVGVIDDFVARIPGQASGDQAEAKGGGAEEGDFVGFGTEKPSGGGACVGDAPPDGFIFLVVAGTGGGKLP